MTRRGFLRTLALATFAAKVQLAPRDAVPPRGLQIAMDTLTYLKNAVTQQSFYTLRT